MYFHIDPHNGLAIYDQIVRQLKFAVARGAVKPGELVPSVRELSKTLGVNPNTVARAYRQLQDDRVLDPVRGTGLAVASGAVDRCKSARTKLIQLRLRSVLAEAKQSNIARDELRALVEAELAALE